MNSVTAKQLLGSTTERIHVSCLLITFRAFKLPVFYNPSFFLRSFCIILYIPTKRSKQCGSVPNPAQVNQDEPITKLEIVQLHLTDTAVQLLVLCLTSEQTTLITKIAVTKPQGTTEDLCTLVKKLLWLLIKISLLSLPL